MLLAIDIGNTNITAGVFSCKSGRPTRMPVMIWRLATNHTSTEDEYGTRLLDLFAYSNLDHSEIRGVAIASVVPALNYVFEQMALRYFHKKPVFVNHMTSPVKILYKNPGEVGADRIANAAAAVALYGSPAIVLDFGTATTFDCVNAKGEYTGGVIVPGPLVACESLARRTAQLPRVEMAKPEHVIGKSTIEGMQSGLYYGYIGLIKELLKRIKTEMEGNPHIIATGGLANVIVPEIKEVKEVVPELTLEGIRIAWERCNKM